MTIPEFYKPYLDLVESDNCISQLIIESEEAFKFYEKINNKTSLFKYENDKWSIRELLGHICDAEQIFAFRLLSILRNEKNALPGFDHNDYVDYANFDLQDWEYLKDRFKLVRRNSLILCEEIRKEDLGKVGNANGHDISIEALVYVIAGHEKHHRNIIRNRYLN